MRILKSELHRLTEGDHFWWATGIEDTFITEPWPKTGRTLDEYELTQHYEKWREDLGLIAKLGVKVARYGIPWHRINPGPGIWDWSWADRSLEYMLQLKVDPILDLVHYGLPRWILGAYVNPDFPQYMAEYASRAAERYKGRIHYYTPLNEPRITAWYCGKLGWWPPFRKGWRGFLDVLVGVCKGIVRSVQAMRAVDPENVMVHVDATDLYETSAPTLEGEVHRRQEIVFLALDLVSGRVTPIHPLYLWLLKHGMTKEILNWFQEQAVELDVIGINLYPLFSRKILVQSPRGQRIRMPYASAEIVERLGHLYYNRYQRPLLIAETASLGSVQRREDWLRDSVQAVRNLRVQGVPMIGYTWWPLFALVTWAYRQGTHPPDFYIKQMGLWDLAPTPDSGLARVATPLVEAYQELVAAGSKAVGTLAKKS